MIKMLLKMSTALATCPGQSVAPPGSRQRCRRGGRGRLSVALRDEIVEERVEVA